MALKTLITAAVQRPDQDATLADILGRLPRSTPPSLARALLLIVETRPPHLAMMAARALARVPDGQGQVFLLEALATLAGPPTVRALESSDFFEQIHAERRSAHHLTPPHHTPNAPSLSLLRPDADDDAHDPDADPDTSDDPDASGDGDALLSEDLPSLDDDLLPDDLRPNALNLSRHPPQQPAAHTPNDPEPDPEPEPTDAPPPLSEAERQRRALLAFGLIELLDLPALGHAWPRVRWVLLRGDAPLRAQLCAKLARAPHAVPHHQWAALVQADLGDEALAGLIEAFGGLLSRGQGHFSLRLRGLISLGEALIDRLDASPAALKLRQTFCRHLARALSSQHFTTRHLMVLLDRLQRSELRRAFLSELRPLMLGADADLDDDEVLRVLFTRRASWLQQQRFSRAPYDRLARALATNRRRALDEALDLLPLPPSADLCRPLLEVIQRDLPEVSLRAAQLLATVRHGQGAVFLIEALLSPGLSLCADLIDLLDLESLGTAWIRVPAALRALGPRDRQHLVQRLMDDAPRVPPWRWEAILLACDPQRDLPIVLRYFQSLLLRSVRHAHADEPNPLQTLRALSDAFIRRLALVAEDPPAVQAAIAELLIERAAYDTSTTRRLLQLLEQTTSASLRRALLLQLLRRIDALTSHLIDEAVSVFVHIVERRQEPFTTLALACLRHLSALGDPADWEPLLACPGSEPRWAVMRALAHHDGDVSAALHDVLSTPDPESRRAAAALIGRRLSAGRSIRDEALAALCARIAQDPDRAVASSLDVQALFHFASPRAARAVALAALRTPHAALLDRALKALGDNALRQHVTTDIPPNSSDNLDNISVDPLCAHIVHLCAHPRCRASSRRLDAVLRLLTAPELPVTDTLRALRPLLGSLELARVDQVVERLQALPDRLWQPQCAAYRALRAGQPADAPLDLVRDWIDRPPSPDARAWLAWLLRPALAHPDPDARLQAARLAASLADPDLLPDLLDALAAAATPEALTATAKALAALRHLGALPPLEALAAHPDCPPEVRRLTQSLRATLQPRVASSRLVWPAPAAPPSAAKAAQRPLRLLSGAVALTDPLPARWWRRAEPYQGRVLGSVAFSRDGWHQRDPRDDDALLSWRLPWSLSAHRAPDPEAVGDLVPLILRFEQDGPQARLTPTVKLWVGRDPAIDALPLLDVPAPFVAPPDVPALLAALRWLLQRHDHPLPLAELAP